MYIGPASKFTQFINDVMFSVSVSKSVQNYLFPNVFLIIQSQLSYFFFAVDAM